MMMSLLSQSILGKELEI